ncbi:MAG: flavin reductase family protein [Victivallales bacterium]|nr:flavin reductase family protein [Victivallales bacterium]
MEKKRRIVTRRLDEEDNSQVRKRSWRPGTMLAPVPAVMVSCGGAKDYKPNIITLAWAGTVCSEPPLLSVSIRPSRYSYEIISKTGEFVVNVTTAKLARATDWCGVKSGRDFDKFEHCRLTPFPSDIVKAPGIAECPINMECQVRRVLKLGSHDMFIAEIKAVHVSEELLDKRGKLRLDKAELLAFSHGEYFVLGSRLGHFGYSVRKK